PALGRSVLCLAVRGDPLRACSGRAHGRPGDPAHPLLDDELACGASDRGTRGTVRAGPPPPCRPVPAAARARAHLDAARMSEELQVGRRRIRLTHPDKVLFPGEGVTKADLAEYYAEIGDAIVPHLRNRPFTLKRYPYGIRGQAYFHK